MKALPYLLLVASTIFFTVLFPVKALGQGAPERGGPAFDRGPAEHSATGRSPSAGQEARSRPRPEDRAHRKREAPRKARSLHVPKGHLPPPGQCRLWYPGRPPGQQPPPTSCRNAYQKQRAPAVVVTHHGDAYRRPAQRWRSRPAGDIVFRRPPQRREEPGFSVQIIIDILGRDGFRRLEEERRRLGIGGTVTGRWESTGPSGSGTLVIQAGRHPIARLVDRKGDGQVDDFYIRDDR